MTFIKCSRLHFSGLTDPSVWRDTAHVDSGAEANTGGLLGVAGATGQLQAVHAVLEARLEAELRVT